LTQFSQQLDDYQQRLTATYGARAHNYESTSENSDWHRRTAALLVDRALLQTGQRVLDIATGTGLVAIDAAERVGPEGYVLGIDITAPMLEQARRKALASGLKQVRFELADAENLVLAKESFDHVLCCAALVWMRNIPQALAEWLTMLSRGGWIGLQTHPETALTTSRILQKLAAAEGIDLRLHREVGSPDRLYTLLDSAGFIDIDILVEPDGYYMTLEQALAWCPDINFPAPGQDPSPLRECTAIQIERLRKGYEEAIRLICTSQGIWLDCTSMFARARRPL
jgi:ubiquinone/menaquinone biosynthesis C-methylase UbiE